MGWLMINLSLIILSSNKGSSLEDGIEIIFSDVSIPISDIIDIINANMLIISDNVGIWESRKSKIILSFFLLK